MSEASVTLKDRISNYVAYALALLAVIEGSLSGLGSDASWISIAVTLAVALIAFFTGKDSNLKAKKL